MDVETGGRRAWIGKRARLGCLEADRARVLELAGLPLEDRRGRFGGVDTAWLEGGDPTGPRVVFLHGALSSGLSWVPMLEFLLRNFRVLMPDLPGYGSSQRVPVSYDKAFYSSWCADFLTAVDGPAALVGNSLGGAIAARTAMEVPDRVRRLALIDPVAVGPGQRPSPGYAMAVLRATTTPQHITAAVMSRLWEGIVVAGTPMTPLMRSIGEFGVSALREPGGTRPFWHGQRDVVRPFTDRELAALTMPTLLIWGALDTVTPVRAGREAVTKIPRAELVVIPDAGHAPFLDRPAHVADVLSAFVGPG